MCDVTEGITVEPKGVTPTLADRNESCSVNAVVPDHRDNGLAASRARISFPARVHPKQVKPFNRGECVRNLRGNTARISRQYGISPLVGRGSYRVSAHKRQIGNQTRGAPHVGASLFFVGQKTRFLDILPAFQRYAPIPFPASSIADMLYDAE